MYKPFKFTFKFIKKVYIQGQFWCPWFIFFFIDTLFFIYLLFRLDFVRGRFNSDVIASRAKGIFPNPHFCFAQQLSISFCLSHLPKLFQENSIVTRSNVFSLDHKQHQLACFYPAPVRSHTISQDVSSPLCVATQLAKM